MADITHPIIREKNVNIAKIFNTMEYGKVAESTSLAKTWLNKPHETLSLYTREGTDECIPSPIYDLHTGELLETIYAPNSEKIQYIIETTKENHVWRNVNNAALRGVLIDRLAREIERHATLISQLEVLIRGILSNDTKTKALPLLIESLQYYASWAVKYKREFEKWETEGHITVSIIDDDSFLANFGFVLGPALAAGYSVILQTAPRISIIAALIIELAENIGVDKGTITLLPGKIDPSIIFKSPDVSIVSLFGNLHHKKYCNIEKPLSKKFLAISKGKTSMVVFNNGDLDSACETAIDAAWGYQGLLPWSVNTILVQEDIFQTFVDKLKYCLTKITMGNAHDKMANVSYPTLISHPFGAKEELKKVLEEAHLQGIEVYQNNPKSSTLQPTLLIGGNLYSNNVMSEERIIPAVTLLAFRTSNEAVNLANNSRYGFAASVWTENISLANEVARKLDVANVWINSHGNFTPAVSMTPHKSSGVGHFGGAEGFFEYIKTYKFDPALNRTDTNKELGLPTTAKEHPKRSYYAGSFKKSESGIIDGLHDSPVKQDLQNAVEAAKKGQQVWSKMTSLMRSRFLRKVADELNATKMCIFELCPKEEVYNWISTIYEGVAQINNLGSVSMQNSYELRSVLEPVGVIAIDDSIGYSNVVVASLLLGNSVIILNSCPDYAQFGIEISKIFQINGIPPGVFNIIQNCNEEIYRGFMSHKELNVYFSLTDDKLLNKTHISDLKRIHPKIASWSDIILNTTQTKNIWSTVGDSVL